MKRVPSIVLLIVTLLFPLVAQARPITDATQENAIEIERQFEQVLEQHPELLVSREIDIYHRYYPSYLFLKQTGKLQRFLLDDINEPLSRLDFVKTLFALNEFDEYAGFKGRYIPQDITEHPEKDILLDALQRGILKRFRSGSLYPEKVQYTEDINQVLTKLGYNKLFANGKTISKGAFIHHIVQDQIAIETPYPDFTTTPELTLLGKQIYADGQPVKGVFVNYLIADVNTIVSEREIRREIQNMKRMGIRGIMTEIGWVHMMPDMKTLQPPRYIDDLMRIAEEEGMWVVMLFSPHYTPAQVFEKYETDIRMVDNLGNIHDEGEYITYSFFSPAVDDQIIFQQKAAQYFAKYNNILAYFLTNEVAYGKYHLFDYSPWAQQAWRSWLIKYDLPQHEIPKYETDPLWKAHKRFRQSSLNDFFNRLYTEVKAVTPRNIPVGHKNIFYEATSAYAPYYGLHPSPKELQSDIIGSDIYGVTPNTHAFHYSFNKPFIIAEAGMPGYWSARSMQQFMMLNMLHGTPIQGLFQWNCGSHENVMFYCDGKEWAKTDGIRKTAAIINALRSPIVAKPAGSMVVIPTHSINLNATDFENNQHLLDELVLQLFEDTGSYPMMVWMDDLVEADYYDSYELYTSEELDMIHHIAIPPSEYDDMNFPLLDLFVPRGDMLWQRNI